MIIATLVSILLLIIASVADGMVEGWELDAITYAVTGNTATSGTMQMGIRKYTAANSFSSVSGLSTFTTTDVRKTANVGITVVEGDYYILHVNSYSFDVSPTGMTATIRFVK